MNARSIQLDDIRIIKDIYESYFKDEFPFIDFLNGFDCSFLIENNDEVVVVGGIRPIAEIVLMTNKSLPIVTKVKGLKEFLNASKYIGDKLGYKMLHAFIQDPIWKQHLIKNGFTPTKGESILYHL